MTIEEAAVTVVRRPITQAVRDVDTTGHGPTSAACADALRCRVIGFGEQAAPWFTLDEWPERAAEVRRLGEETADLLERAHLEGGEAAA